MIAQLAAHQQSGDHLMDREQRVRKSLSSWLSKAHDGMAGGHDGGLPGSD